MSSLQRQIMALGPVGYWPMDETTGTTAFDLSGNGRNGTYTSVSLAARQFGGLRLPTFDGSSSYMDVANNAAFHTDTGTSGLLSVFWLEYQDPEDVTPGIIVNTLAAGTVYGVAVEYQAANDRHSALCIGGGESMRVNGSAYSPVTQIFRALCYTYDYANSVARLVCNGVTIGTTTTGRVSANNSGVGLRVARRIDDGTSFFNGSIGQLAWFGTALTEAQAQGLTLTGQRAGCVGG